MSTAKELGERIKVLAASYAAATQHDDSDWLKEARSLLHDKIDALVSLAQPGEGALTDEQIERTITNWFSEDWAIRQARGLLGDLGITSTPTGDSNG